MSRDQVDVANIHCYHLRFSLDKANIHSSRKSSKHFSQYGCGFSMSSAIVYSLTFLVVPQTLHFELRHFPILISHIIILNN